MFICKIKKVCKKTVRSETCRAKWCKMGDKYIREFTKTQSVKIFSVFPLNQENSILRKNEVPLMICDFEMCRNVSRIQSRTRSPFLCCVFRLNWTFFIISFTTFFSGEFFEIWLFQLPNETNCTSMCYI